MALKDGRQVEVVGAGLAGLVVASALAQRGWRVRVHEKAAALRMFGAGIWLWENGLRVLEAIDALDETMSLGGQRIFAWEIRDSKHRVIWRRVTTPADRMWLPERGHLYHALINATIAAGADIVTDSIAVAATPDGDVVFQDGTTVNADLVVGADGVYSKVRDSLGLCKEFTQHPAGGVRVLVPRQPYEICDKALEYWIGGRGFLYNGCSAKNLYLFFGTAADDQEAGTLPVNKDLWKHLLPDFAHVIDRVGEGGRWDNFSTIRCHRWSDGRVAIIGDAAHALPPYLGQGANMAFSNALALAEFVTGASDIASALRRWEKTVRPLTDHTQTWSNRYGRVASLWPSHWESARRRTVQLLASVPYVDRQVNLASRTMPIGTR